MTKRDCSSPEHVTGCERTSYLFEQSFTTDPWRTIATNAEFPLERLRSAESEILDMIERVVVRGKGWSKKDKLRDIRDRIPISPRKLSKHGKKLSPRTYERAIRRLEQLGLLKHESTGANQIRVFSPGWWPSQSAEKALTIWVRATATFQSLDSLSSTRRANDAQLALSGRSADAPPVLEEPTQPTEMHVDCEHQGATDFHTDTENGNQVDGRDSLER